ncbi:MAG TPA: hypothetical protein VGT44_00125, partial [Ktedonobacteraceae bacterium]|nr:hypothetical protein [Ktedonobacteraceae bacterium]
MKLVRNRFAKHAVVLGVSLTLLVSLLITLPLAVRAAQHQNIRALAPADMQNLIFVWASGTPAVQQQALIICQAEAITPANCAAISADVRSAWLALMQVDPASLGRIGVQDNPVGRTQVYSVLAGQLSSLTQGNEILLLSQTQQTLQLLDASLQQVNGALGSAGATSYTVWATSFKQKSKTGRYVALPDAYLKFANEGAISSIPSIYQTYYAPNGVKTSWSVS